MKYICYHFVTLQILRDSPPQFNQQSFYKVNENINRN